MTTITIKELRERAERLHEEVVAMRPQLEELEKKRGEAETRHTWFVKRMKEFESSFVDEKRGRKNEAKSLIKYDENALPNLKIHAASWMQLKVFRSPNYLLLEGYEDVLKTAIHSLRLHANRHKQIIGVDQLSRINFRDFDQEIERLNEEANAKFLVPENSSEVKKE